MEFRQDEGEPEHRGFNSAAMRERVVQPTPSDFGMPSTCRRTPRP
jgi:hypothetical protein